MAKNKKRDDIQGLRAVAIIAVLLFHIWPSVFKNGYAGVDIFFVLSGYLMAMILSRKEINSTTIFDFYMRRIHRIIPCYILTLFLVLILEAYNFLLHTWSLAVELQYYLIVPFIFYLLGDSARKNLYITLYILATILNFSISLYIISYFIYESFSFNFTLCRIWQFVLGTMAYFWEDDDQENGSNPIATAGRRIKNLQLDSEKELLLESEEKSVDEEVSKPKPTRLKRVQLLFCDTPCIASTLITALILAYHKRNTSMVFNNCLLSYIGDISYILYLVHWPLIQFFRYYNTGDKNDPKKKLIDFSCLFLSFSTAIIVHHAFEKPLLNVNVKRQTFVKITGVFHMVLICTTLYLFLKPQIWREDELKFKDLNGTDSEQLIAELFGPERDQIIKSLTLKKSIELNKFMGKHRGDFNNSEYGYCEMNETKFVYKFPEYKASGYIWKCEDMSSGNLSVLVVGNSHAFDAFPSIRAALKGKYKFLRIFAMSNCIPFDIYTGGSCPWAYNGTIQMVRELKPDLLVLFFKYNDGEMRKPISPEKISTDKRVLEVQKSLDFFKIHSKSILFNTPNLTPNTYVREALIQRLTLHLNTTDMHEPLQKYLANNDNVFKRFDELKCEKCVKMDQQKIFCDSIKCDVFDEETNLAYFKDQNGHLTLYGRYRIYTPMQETIEKALKLIHS